MSTLARSRAILLPLTREEGPIEAATSFVFLEDFDDLNAQASNFLASSEADYFAGLRFLRRQQSYLSGRYAAKLAIQLLLREPDLRKIEIYPGTFGQPLVSYLSRKTPELTISHCDTLAVALAYTAGHPMAVDVERADPARLKTIQTQMSPREREWAGSAPTGGLIMSTLIWTAKESMAKVVCCGLTSPMEIFNLSEFVSVGNDRWQGFFENFTQYKVLSFAQQTIAISIVLPKKSNLGAEDFEKFMAAAMND